MHYIFCCSTCMLVWWCRGCIWNLHITSSEYSPKVTVYKQKHLIWKDCEVCYQVVEQNCLCHFVFYVANFLLFYSQKLFSLFATFEITYLCKWWFSLMKWNKKKKGLPQQAKVAWGVPGRLRPRIFLAFGTMRVVGCQPYTPAAFTPGEIPGTHF